MLRRKGRITTEAPKHVASRLDALVYFVAITGMVMTLDQVRLIWIDHNASGVSLLTWGFYTAASCVWCGYGKAHKDNVIFFTSMGWIFINGAVALGVMMYGV